ncbi:MAG: 50S ribosomal protein L12 [archaeon]
MEYIYAALLLHKLGKEVNEDGIKKVVEAAGGTADESKVKTLIASLKGVDIEQAIKESVALAAPIAGTQEQKKEEPKEERKEEAAEGLAALFG